MQLVDAVSGAFSQICVHLSQPLYDMVLNQVYDYATQNVRSNAVRAIHQLVECVANANPQETLDRFLPICDKRIRTELEHGASSLRITSGGSTPLPSDATLHWSKLRPKDLSRRRLNPLQTLPFSGVPCTSQSPFKLGPSIQALTICIRTVMAAW